MSEREAEIVRYKEQVTGGGLLLIITGPAGVGKDTVREELQKRGFSAYVTFADRDPRPGEIEGETYRFIPPEDFQQRIEDDFFLEYTNYRGCKGTGKDLIERVLSGEKIIWRVDPQMAAGVKVKFIDRLGEETAKQVLEKTLVIYLGVESLFDLRSRQKARGVYNKNEFIDVLRRDINELNQLKSNFPQVVKNRNGELGRTVTEILAIIDTFMAR